MHRAFFPVLLAGLCPVTLVAQKQKSELDPTHWGLVYDLPATRNVVLRGDIPFGNVGDQTLKLDIYQPPRLKSGEKRPAVIFLNAAGGPLDDSPRRWAIYQSWPRMVAANGFIGISMDGLPGRGVESVATLFRFVRKEGARYGIDTERLGVYAASANVSGGYEYLTSAEADKGIRAAALYYGGVPEGRLRPDLPVLFIVAQTDVPRMGPALPALWQRVVDSALPWTLTFGKDLPHGFDAFSDTDDSRRLIQQTLAFWRSHLEAMPARPAPSEGRAIVASIYAHDQERTASGLRRWVTSHPRDAVAFAQYGSVLTGLGQLPAADSAWNRAYQIDSLEPGIIDGLAQLRISQRRWPDAEQLYLRLVTLGHDDSQIQGQLGWTRLNQGKNAEAVGNYEKALELGVPPGRFQARAWYNLACGYVRLGRKDDAFRALGKAIDQGLSDRATFEGDDDLRPLRDDPRFGQLLSRLNG